MDREEHGRAKYEWLQRFLPLPHGMPSHDTSARGFAQLKPEVLRTCRLAWLTEVQERIGGLLASQLAAIDGKAARHSFDRAIHRGPRHLVSEWATAAPLVLGQVAVEQKSHASTAIPTLLELLELSGCVVTIDAMGPQKREQDDSGSGSGRCIGSQGQSGDVARGCRPALCMG